MKEYIFRDPVHGNISVTDPTVLALIDSPPFQRLRRIRQLGTSYISYPGAEHTRFAHSLGVYHLMGRVLRYLLDRRICRLSEGEFTVAQVAALLHDIGHGPFSHAFEKVTGTDHEGWTQRIIRTPGNDIHDALARRDPAWPDAVAAHLAGGGAPAFIGQLLASQLDVDRMDYLLRDSLMCGVPYGHFDLERLIQTITLHDEQVVVSEKGQTAAEAFLLGRYFMYWNVYLHKATRAAEILLEKVLGRARDLAAAGETQKLDPLPHTLAGLLTGQTPSLSDFLRLDESDVLFAIKGWAGSADPVLADLAARFIGRRLFQGIRIDEHVHRLGARSQEIEAALAGRGFAPAEYYSHVDEAAGVPYPYYVRSDQPIWVQCEDRRLREISTVSPVLGSISGQPVERQLLFVPKEAADAVLRILES